MATFITVVLITYALFSVSGILFPTDLTYYASLKKPLWTPPPKLFGIVWGILYGLISISIAITYMKTDGFKEVSLAYFIVLLINYAANQAFTFFQFKLKNQRLAFLDTLVVAFTTFLLIYYTIPYSKLAAWLLVPYLIWSCFASLLAGSIYQLNKDSHRAY